MVPAMARPRPPSPEASICLIDPTPQPIARAGETSGTQQTRPATSERIARVLVLVPVAWRIGAAWGGGEKTWAPGAEYSGAGASATGAGRAASAGTSKVDAQAVQLAR